MTDKNSTVSVYDDKSVYLVNLGCPKNLVDGEVMLGLLSKRGYHFCLDPEEAKILIVNTCSFIDEAKEESIETILDLGRQKSSANGKQLIVTGCLAQRYAEALRDEMPEVDVFVGTGEFVRIAEILEEKKSLIDRQPITYVGASHVLPDHTVPRVQTTDFFTAYLKVAEGCNHKCAFCIIPKIRGRQESRPVASLVSEAGTLASQGVREINLIAQDLTAYGRERRDGTTLLALLKRLREVDGIEWIRLLYCYPNYLDDAFLRLVAEEKKICSYIDMPLQHISDRMLRLMKREKSGDGIRRLLDRIRENVPNVVLRTSFIVGFPGEQDRDFEELMDFVSAAAIDHVGVFRYSQEEGTAAGTMDGQVSEQVKNERWDMLMKQQAEVVRRKNLSLIGDECSVLVCGSYDEGQEGIIAHQRAQGQKVTHWGRTAGQAPDIDGIVLLEDFSGEVGEITSTRIVGSEGYDLRGLNCESSMAESANGLD